MSEPPVRIAVVGAGPAGFYAAGHLLKEADGNVEVDMIERLPTPWGLVRSGVAPDHPKIKSVTRVYEKTAAHPRFRWYGNVEVGRDVSREELRRHYHAVVYATGAPADRPLGIPGEELPGSWAATDFVGWYNGHPDHPDLEFDLGCERAVVIGNGNVALDVARMIVTPNAALARTDVADHALHALRDSAIREVVVAGRRGPAQAAFTNPELLELREMTGAEVRVDPAEVERALATPDPTASRTAETNVRILREYAAAGAAAGGRASAAGGTGEQAGTGPTGQPTHGQAEHGEAKRAGDSPAERAWGGEAEWAGEPRRIVLRFMVSPVELVPDARGHVAAVRFARNELRRAPGGGVRAEPTGETETIAAGLVLRAIGYRGVPVPGVPFDEHRGTIANEHGRVVGPEGPQRGEYAVGWIKRGPTGVIGTNKRDAQETVDALREDMAAGRLHEPPEPDPQAWEHTLRARRPELVTYAGWEEIDRHEQARGAPAGRPRVKLTRIEEMLRVAAAEHPER